MQNIYLSNLFCNVPRANYHQQSIDKLAESIVATGGLLRPLIVRAIGVDENEFPLYEVLDGYLAYFAACKAKEDNLLLNDAPCWVLADFEDIQYPLQQLEELANLATPVDDLDYLFAALDLP